MQPGEPEVAFIPRMPSLKQKPLRSKLKTVTG